MEDRAGNLGLMMDRSTANICGKAHDTQLMIVNELYFLLVLRLSNSEGERMGLVNMENIASYRQP